MLVVFFSNFYHFVTRFSKGWAIVILRGRGLGNFSEQEFFSASGNGRIFFSLVRMFLLHSSLALTRSSLIQSNIQTRTFPNIQPKFLLLKCDNGDHDISWDLMAEASLVGKFALKLEFPFMTSCKTFFLSCPGRAQGFDTSFTMCIKCASERKCSDKTIF